MRKPTRPPLAPAPLDDQTGAGRALVAALEDVLRPMIVAAVREAFEEHAARQAAPRHFLTAAEAEAALRTSNKMLARLRREGMPYVALTPSHFRYDIDRCLEWLRTRRAKPPR
jgi:hypothetical protein